ncbi:MAG TPA: CAP domain-containing protein [Polyangiaceae bacterium]|nr:CAP domain-containing protein [Polyangiaceae bacterium]
MFLRGLVVLGALFGMGCTLQSAVPGRFPAESISVPDDVSQYSTAAQPDGAVGGGGVEQLQADVASALAKRGEHADADGALSAAASWALSEVNKGHPVDLIAIDLASRHFGFAGILISMAAFDMQHQDPWRDQLERAPRNVPITRYGIRVSPSGRSAAVVYGSAEINYESIPRALDPGQSVTLKGQVGARFAFCHVYLTKPDGTVEEKRMPNRALDASFALEMAGKYRLEVMGDGATGPVVISNVPLYVGIPEPAASIVAGTVVEPEQAEARMLVLLNEARAAAGLNPVQPDTELRELALAHSTDMVDHNFFGHVSPSTGTPTDRLHRSGILVSIFGENVSEALTPEIAHEGLMSSPGHRANMLRPEFTHVGIGARKNDNGLVVTMEFGRRPSPAAMPANAAQVEAAIVALRAAKNLPAAGVDPIYRAAAQVGAEAYANGADEGEIGKAVQSTIGREVDRLHSSRAGGCLLATELLELSQLSDAPGLSLSGLRRFGVGARVRRDSKGVRLSTVFVLEGAPCK